MGRLRFQSTRHHSREHSISFSAPGRTTAAFAPRRRGFARIIATAALVAASLTTFGVTSASAHDVLTGTAPAADETVSVALTQVTLTFSEPPLAGAPSAIEVTDAAGASVVTGEVAQAESVLSVPVTPTVAGAYTVTWQTAADDGHTISGQFAFTYAGPLPSPSSSPTPSASLSPSATVSPTPEPSPSSSEQAVTTQVTDPVGGFLPLIVGVLIVVAIAAGVAITRAVRKRNRTS